MGEPMCRNILGKSGRRVLCHDVRAGAGGAPRGRRRGSSGAGGDRAARRHGAALAAGRAAGARRLPGRWRAGCRHGSGANAGGLLHSAARTRPRPCPGLRRTGRRLRGRPRGPHGAGRHRRHALDHGGRQRGDLRAHPPAARLHGRRDHPLRRRGRGPGGQAAEQHDRRDDGGGACRGALGRPRLRGGGRQGAVRDAGAQLRRQFSCCAITA